MDKESVATYKIVKDGLWYLVYEYNELLVLWECRHVALTYTGAQHVLRKLINKKNRVKRTVAYFTEDGRYID